MKTKEKVDYWALIPEEFKNSIIDKELANYIKNPIPKHSVTVFDFFDIKDKTSLSELIKKLQCVEDEFKHRYGDLIVSVYQYYDDCSISIDGVTYMTSQEIISNVIKDAKRHYHSYKRSISKEIKEKEEYERLKKKFENK